MKTKTTKTTKIEMLIQGIIEIAQNHNSKPLIENWEEDMNVGILCYDNVPCIADVQMLAVDLGIGRANVFTNMFGVDIDIPYEWYKKQGNKTYRPKCDFWRKKK